MGRNCSFVLVSICLRYLAGFRYFKDFINRSKLVKKIVNITEIRAVIITKHSLRRARRTHCKNRGVTKNIYYRKIVYLLFYELSTSYRLFGAIFRLWRKMIHCFNTPISPLLVRVMVD